MPAATSIAPNPQGTSWHAQKAAVVLASLDVTDEGLTSAEAQARQHRHGPNELRPPQPSPWWLILLRQFGGALIYVLLVAAVVSLIFGELVDALFIFVTLALNAVIGGYQEWRAERNTLALQKLLRIRATVLRDGEPQEIDAREIVPGDVVWLESGNRVPADLRLLTAQGLETDESLLTGESVPVVKDATLSLQESVPLADRVNMAHAGSLVVRGRARGVVVATGLHTAVGELAQAVAGIVGGKPPLMVRMEEFTRAVGIGVLGAALLVLLTGVFYHGRDFTEMFLFAVAMAVSAIPEGLPVAWTVALSMATLRMARRGVIVRRLAAVEGLGSCTLIASDKTGTLTCNELTVRAVRLADGSEFNVTGQGYAVAGVVQQGDTLRQAVDHPGLALLGRAAVLCNEASLHLVGGHWQGRGDPTDVALLVLGHKLGLSHEATLDRYEPLEQIPFEPERRYAASYHRVDGRSQVFVKGAPERLLAMCLTQPEELRRWQAAAETLAERGYRVLALAAGPASQAHLAETEPPEPAGLTFLGLVGMIDPLREGVKEAVQSCHDAGIQVCMVTGDHPVTALTIARELGLATTPEQVCTGAELEGVTPTEMQDLLRRVRVFARVTPRQKLELVEAARAAGHFVAVTGDGVNDAPALRAANVGVAMGQSGTDVARETAELVISDDNFATIVAGVEEGRIAYDNVRKAVYLLVSTGVAEMVLVFLALITGSPLPLLPAQFLWLNLVTNGIQDLALALEPGEPGVLRRQPRPPCEPIFNRLMIERTVVAALVIGGLSFLTFRWLLDAGWEEASARNLLLLLLVLFENIHVGNCRSETRSVLVLSPLQTPMLLIGTALAQLLHIAMLYLPLGHQVLRTEPVSFGMWLLLLTLALTVLVVMELHKWLWRLRHPENA